MRKVHGGPAAGRAAADGALLVLAAGLPEVGHLSPQAGRCLGERREDPRLKAGDEANVLRVIVHA